jgi:cell division protein FtsI/penicillin-binding protein 2
MVAYKETQVIEFETIDDVRKSILEEQGYTIADEVPQSVLDLQAQAELEAEQIALSVKAEQEKQEALNTLKVTISTGKVFYADPISRADISDAVKLSEILGTTETQWKLAEEYDEQKIVTVTINELQEALMLGLQHKASIIGVVE